MLSVLWRIALFPYTTLFRSDQQRRRDDDACEAELERVEVAQPAAHDERGRRDHRREHDREQRRAGEEVLQCHQGRSEEHSLNSSHLVISYAVFCLKKKKMNV